MNLTNIKGRRLEACALLFFFALMVNPANAISFSYVPRMTLYGNVSDVLTGSIPIYNTNNVTIDVTVNAPPGFYISTFNAFHHMAPNENVTIPFSMIANVSGINYNYITLSVSDGKSIYPFQVEILTNIGEKSPYLNVTYTNVTSDGLDKGVNPILQWAIIIIVSAIAIMGVISLDRRMKNENRKQNQKGTEKTT